jgi:transcriptional regulator with XRE-family HTH domain
MIPFGRCLTLWRKERGLSQAALAQKAGVPQPNLSDIERGEREVSLRTLRALALALNITPGLLADGIGPMSEQPLVLTRERLERVAQAVVEGKPLVDRDENELANQTARLMKGRLRAVGAKGRKLSTGGSTPDPWRSLGESYRPEEIQSLVERVSEKAAAWVATQR